MSHLHDTPPEPASEDELFLEFANTVDLTDGVPTDAVADGASLRAWLVERSLIGARTAASAVEGVRPAFHDLRDVIRACVARLAQGAPPTASQLRALNDVLREGVHHHELRHDRSTDRFTFRPIGDELAQARSAIAGSLAHYLADHDVRRLRVCANDGCRWLFVDRSRAGRRRWCDMRICGNRAKVRRHRARRSALAS